MYCGVVFRGEDILSVVWLCRTVVSVTGEVDVRVVFGAVEGLIGDMVDTLDDTLGVAKEVSSLLVSISVIANINLL